MAIAGLILAFVFAPLGLLLSLLALGRTGPGKEGGRGLAIAGSVISGLGLLGGIVIIGVAVAAAGNSSDTTVAQPEAPQVTSAVSDPATPEPTTAEPPAVVPPSTEAAPAEPTPAAGPGVGTPATDGEFTFTVTRMENIGTTVGEGLLAQTAQGEFVVVYVSVTNSGNEAKSFSATNQVLYDDQDRKYETSSALFVMPDADKAFLENINPGNTVTEAPLLYDLAPGTVLDRIELHDVFYSPGVDVALR